MPLAVTPEEKKRIQKWNQGLSSDVELRLIMTEDQRSVELKDFCEGLASLAPKVRVAEDEGDPKDLPALGIGPRLRYHAVPFGPELEPFLEALSSDKAPPPSIQASTPDYIERISLPVFLSLFIAPQCPHCPVTVRRLLPLPAANQYIQLAIIDGTLFPEMAQAHKIRSVPTILLDGQFRWTGSFRLEEIVAMMIDRDPAKLSPGTLESMLKDGNASQVAEIMLDTGQIYAAFLELLVHEKMFVRLGAMVVVEELADRNPALASQVIDPLWERFPDVGDQVKGDIIHVLGEAGDDSLVPRLEAVLSCSYNKEVKEAAKEVLSKIKMPHL